MSLEQNCRAVDRAVTALCELVDATPHVLRLVERRRWQKPKRVRRDPTSSWEYFRARYGTLTCLVDEELRADKTFLVGNVSGQSALIALGDWSVDAILGPALESKRLRGHGLETAIVFHGGWGQEGYAFDTRVTSPEGEHPIYRFSIDEPLPGFPHERDLAKRTKIVPFGVWLEREVVRIARTIRPAVRRLARPRTAAKRGVSEPVTSRGLPGVEVGAPYARALAALGKPDRTTTGKRVTAAWRKLGLVIEAEKAIERLTLWYSERWFRHNTAIESAVAIAPWRTDRGIGAGSTPAEVREAYGKAIDSGGYKDATGRHDWLVYEGIGFHFFNGSLARIDVFPRSRRRR